MVRQRIRAVSEIYEWFDSRYERLEKYTSGSTADSSGLKNIRALLGIYEWFRHIYERSINNRALPVYIRLSKATNCTSIIEKRRTKTTCFFPSFSCLGLFNCTSCSVFQFKQQVASRDGFACADVDGFDSARERCLDGCFHLHRFGNEQVFSPFYLCACRDGHF